MLPNSLQTHTAVLWYPQNHSAHNECHITQGTQFPLHPAQLGQARFHKAEALPHVCFY